MAKKAKHEEHENLERWLVSYADFITLLFTFFVMLYAISTVNTGKFKVLSHAIVLTFSHQPVSSNVHIIIPHSRVTAGKATPHVNTVLFRMMQLIQERSSSHGAMKATQSHRGIRIRIQAAFLFQSGHAKVRKEAIPFLKQIAGVLSRTKRSFRIEGHTDDVPIHGRYKNNWTLSTMRAVNVLMELLALGPIDPRNASAAGYSHYRPIVPNTTDANRKKNRRVEIVILKKPDQSLATPAPVISSPSMQEGGGESVPSIPSPVSPGSTDLPAPRI